MFLTITLILLVISFILAVRSLKSVNEKPEVKDVKKSLDKHRIIYHSQSSNDSAS